VTWLPVIPNPGKIVCVGLNYEEHRQKRARQDRAAGAVPAPCRVAGGPPAADPAPARIEEPRLRGRDRGRDRRAGRRISQKDSWNHIAGYSCYNDGSVRDWQRHTIQWTAGKNFASTAASARDGDRRRDPRGSTADAVVPPERRAHAARHHRADDLQVPKLIEYISTFTTLLPGDVIVTGTPGGVGARRTPPVWMKPGDTVEIEIDKVGVLVNTIADD